MAKKRKQPKGSSSKPSPLQAGTVHCWAYVTKDGSAEGLCLAPRNLLGRAAIPLAPWVDLHTEDVELPESYHATLKAAPNRGQADIRAALAKGIGLLDAGSKDRFTFWWALLLRLKTSDEIALDEPCSRLLNELSGRNALEMARNPEHDYTKGGPELALQYARTVLLDMPGGRLREEVEACWPEVLADDQTPGESKPVSQAIKDAGHKRFAEEATALALRLCGRGSLRNFYLQPVAPLPRPQFALLRRLSQGVGEELQFGFVGARSALGSELLFVDLTFSWSVELEAQDVAPVPDGSEAFIDSDDLASVLGEALQFDEGETWIYELPANLAMGTLPRPNLAAALYWLERGAAEGLRYGEDIARHCLARLQVIAELWTHAPAVVAWRKASPVAGRILSTARLDSEEVVLAPALVRALEERLDGGLVWSDEYAIDALANAYVAGLNLPPGQTPHYTLLAHLGRALPPPPTEEEEILADRWVADAPTPEPEEAPGGNDQAPIPAEDYSLLAPPAPIRESAPAPVTPPASLPVICTDRVVLQCEWGLPGGHAGFAQARESLLDWLGRKLGVSIPDHWRDGPSEAEHRGLRVEVEANEGLFALRFEHPDTSLVGRRWRVEATIVRPAGEEGQGVAAVRMLVLDSTHLPAPSPGMPAFVHDWLRAPGLQLRDHPVGSPVEHGGVEGDTALQALSAAGGQPGLVLVARAGEVVHLPRAFRPLVVHVALDPAACASYEQRVAPIADQRVHLYPPGVPEPQWRELPARALEEGALWSLMQVGHDRVKLPPFADVRRQVRDANRVARMRKAPEAPAPSSAEDREMLALYEAELERVMAEHSALEADLERRTAELHEAKAALWTARQREAALAAAPGAAPSARVAPAPRHFSELPALAQALRQRVVIVDKAVKTALEHAGHMDEQKAMAAVQALHDHYWPMRWDPEDADARRRWTEFLTTHRLRFSPTGEAVHTARYAEAYRAQYEGRTYELDWHLAGSSARDTRRCLRIYVATCDETRRVVIGHLPSHLPCRIHYSS